MENPSVPKSLHAASLTRIVFAVIMVSLMPSMVPAQSCTLNAPSSITIVNTTSCSITYSWKRVNGASKYRVRYKKSGSNNWKGSARIPDSTYTFTGLTAGTNYVVSVQSVCSNNQISSKSKTKTTSTAVCSLPVSYSKNPSGITGESITVNNTCSFDSLYCRYGLSPASLNSTAKSNSATVTLSNLVPNTKYYFKLSTCPLVLNNFTSTDSFVTGTSTPNIILIILDDARYDFYGCNGAPSFMQTPNIDRIAHEGINFKNSFVPLSECAPSRASIATGDYAFRTKVIDNTTQRYLNQNLALLPKILHDHGYTTGLVGKNHSVFNEHGGYFDYWLEFTSKTDGYNLSFRYFNTNKVIPGYGADVLSDSAVRFIQRSPQPYLLWLAYHVPHDPLVPATPFAHIYDSDTMPLGVDTAKYTENYPSCVYAVPGVSANSDQAATYFRKTYEMIQSAEQGVGRVFATLDSLGELDNTLILFTSDNGHLLGEHFLDMKRTAYEQSIRVPMFIRYPAWFPAGTIDSSNYVLNLDIAPTVLQAAGIPNNYNMNGQSMKNFYDHTSSRNTLYYHYWYSTASSWDLLPAIHAVRDDNYILVDYGCQSNVVQEFFDLKNDPLELTNQINNSAYDSIINVYRSYLTGYETSLGDTAPEPKIPCSITNPQYTKQEELIQRSNFVAYPSLVSDFLTVINTGDGDLHFSVVNDLGEVIQKFDLAAGEQTALHNLASGLHYLEATDGSNTQTAKFVVQ